MAQFLKRFRNIRKDFEFLKGVRRMRFSVLDKGAINHAITIQKYRYPTYHFVALICSTGFDTRQCQTTA